eukprot:CAMPEP_0204375452 /NCGR_PEP_ID=MMETSP0469-20131031/49239_1 /ASSEMBLY_ACC=CAM_ASM_000384 /TAXON_ID=2969 /ORGANISM="Oxyrrhis marina" /LENGTH=53 /DNA_ID=CAMNT_0051366139 /DNA_START=182 /DNA_END=339 /DNA_ORIENTATION=+
MWSQVAPCGAQWSQVAPGCPQWSRLVPSGRGTAGRAAATMPTFLLGSSARGSA